MDSEQWDLWFAQVSENQRLENNASLFCAVCGGKLLFSISPSTFPYNLGQPMLFANCPVCQTERRAHELAEVLADHDECRDREFHIWLSNGWSVPGDMPAYTSHKKHTRSSEWKKATAEEKRRAGFRCRLCNRASKEVHDPETDNYSPVVLHAHHRTYVRLGKEDREDLTILCAGCHLWFGENYEYDKQGHCFIPIPIDQSIQDLFKK